MVKFPPLCILVVALVVRIQADVPPNFSRIQNVPQDIVQSIDLGGDCSTHHRIPKVMYTLEPSEEVVVATSPADLVTVDNRQGELHLTWNTEVAKSATSGGGIYIAVPATQLNSVSVSSDAQAQLLDGFKSLTSIKVSSDAKFFGTLWAGNTTTSNLAPLSVSVSSDGRATMVTDAPLVDVSVSSDGHLQLATSASLQTLKVSSDGQVQVKAETVENVRGSSDASITLEATSRVGFVRLSSDAEMKLYGGNWTVGGELSSDAHLEFLSGDISPGVIIEARSDARIEAKDCSAVQTSSDGRCVVVDENGDALDDAVQVTVPLQPYTRIGMEGCFSWYGSHSLVGRLLGGTTGVVVLAIVLLFVWRRQSRCQAMKKETKTKQDPYDGSASSKQSTSIIEGEVLGVERDELILVSGGDALADKSSKVELKDVPLV